MAFLAIVGSNPTLSASLNYRFPESGFLQFPSAAASPENMGRKILIFGGIGSLLIALLHVAVPIIGAEAYLACGGWWLLPLLEQGSPLPAILTLSIAAIFFLWSAFAFSGASLLRRLPLLRLGLILISAIYILRGFDLFPTIISGFYGIVIEIKSYVFSAIALILGVFHLSGLLLLWKTWDPRPSLQLDHSAGFRPSN
jgi:hypothetical protein